LSYNGPMEPEEAEIEKAIQREKEAARKATREMKTAIIVMLLSFVLVGVTILLIVLIGHIQLS
jgi:hypothetical protein